MFQLFYIKILIKKIFLPSRSIAKVTVFQLMRIMFLRRFKTGSLLINKTKFEIADSASFIFMYYEIFEKEIYSFKAEGHPVIFDCGANVGLSVLYYKFLYPTAIIKAFEPDPTIFQILERNVKRFNFSDVELHNKGIWSERTTLSFNSQGADAGKITQKQHVDLAKLIKIDTVQLSPYLVGNIDMIKIDVEGAENEVFKEIKFKLNKVKNIFVEYHSFVDRKQKLESILTILADSGFRYHIQHVGVSSERPFDNINSSEGMDNQLNIFAYRNEQ